MPTPTLRALRLPKFTSVSPRNYIHLVTRQHTRNTDEHIYLLLAAQQIHLNAYTNTPRTAAAQIHFRHSAQLSSLGVTATFAEHG